MGEVSRRIIAKAVISAVREDMTRAAGALQVCAGQEGGVEAAIHAMDELFCREDVEGVLLADASNAFNVLNRSCALHNIQFICPSLCNVLKNTYQAPIRMFIPGGGEILSSEGTTQGDPLGMAMYALAIKPLINELHNSCDKANQVWFADDASAAAKCQHLRKWWDLLSTRGPKYGYCPNGKKSFLIVKECYLDEATHLFEGTGITITTIGARHLGAALGSSQFKEEYVKLKVSQ